MHAKRVYGSSNWTHVRGLYFMGAQGLVTPGMKFRVIELGLAMNLLRSMHIHSPSDRLSRQNAQLM